MVTAAATWSIRPESPGPVQNHSRHSPRERQIHFRYEDFGLEEIWSWTTMGESFGAISQPAYEHPDIMEGPLNELFRREPQLEPPIGKSERGDRSMDSSGDGTSETDLIGVPRKDYSTKSDSVVPPVACDCSSSVTIRSFSSKSAS